VGAPPTRSLPVNGADAIFWIKVLTLALIVVAALTWDIRRD